ncbi:MAG: c-type cytochrome domain-containing protein, partial [Limisphaerales bacterium]
MLPLLPFLAKQDRPLAIDARLIGMACLVALGSISEGFALESFEVRAGAFIRDHCLECHSSQMPKGELDLEIMLTPGQFQRYYPEWSSVLDRVAQGEMPPAEADQPSPQEKLELTELIAETIRNESAQGSGDPGAVI